MDSLPFITIRRPLLNIRKERILATVKDANITYALDPTNSDDRFDRSRIRKAVSLMKDTVSVDEILCLQFSTLE